MPILFALDFENTLPIPNTMQYFQKLVTNCTIAMNSLPANMLARGVFSPHFSFFKGGPGVEVRSRFSCIMLKFALRVANNQQV